jgi:hypothetical protein
MTKDRENPLPPASKELLQTCVDIESTETKVLARRLSRARSTVDTEFQRILLLTGTGSRSEALVHALHQGWIELERSPNDAKDV